LKPINFILGGSQTDFLRNWSKEGKGIRAMFREVIQDALISLNIDESEIINLVKNQRIAFFIGNFAGERYVDQGHLGALITDLDPIYNGVASFRYEAACASGSVAIDAARTKISAGEIDLAIVVGIEIMKSLSSDLGSKVLGLAADFESEAKDIIYPFPKLFGQLANIILKRYKLDERLFLDNLAEISNTNYSNAKNNPLAQTRLWYMSKSHAVNRYDKFNPSIGGKLCVSDCSQITDGAAVVVLASEKYTKEYARKRSIKLSSIPFMKGYGVRVGPLKFSDKITQSSSLKTILPWTKKAIDDAYQMAKLNFKDIDLFETHDCFTSSEYVAISMLGYCKPGEEHLAIGKGEIKFNAKKPLNPSGGLIGVGHPVGASGVRMMLDLYKQVANKATTYQVEGAKNAMMLNIGGTATSNFSFIIGV